MAKERKTQRIIDNEELQEVNEEIGWFPTSWSGVPVGRVREHIHEHLEDVAIK